jgi:hypothetical protein
MGWRVRFCCGRAECRGEFVACGGCEYGAVDGCVLSGYVRGVGKAEALRRAQVELLRDKQYADPYFWAGFVLMGAER